MTQAELDRQIASLTGEDLQEIRRHGFSICEPDCDDARSEWEPPLILDWDDAGPGRGPVPSNLDELIGWAA